MKWNIRIHKKNMDYDLGTMGLDEKNLYIHLKKAFQEGYDVIQITKCEDGPTNEFTLPKDQYTEVL